MKVLVIDYNAVRSQDRELYRAIAAAGDCEIRVVAPRTWIDMGRINQCEPEPTDLTVIPTNVVFRSRAHRVMFLGLRRIFRSFSPDIIFANAEPENQLAFQIIILRRLLVPAARIILCSWRNIDHRVVGLPYVFAPMHAAIEKYTSPRVDRVVTYSETALQLFRRYHMPAVKINPAIRPEQFTATASLVDQEGRFTVGFVGRFIEDKGGDVLLSAFAGLPRNTRLLMVGAGERETAWRQKVLELGLSGRVEWIPTVPRERVPAVLQSMDVLVLPSRTGQMWKEQFGRVLIEAMATCTAVIGSDSGEIPSVIGDAGVVVPEGNAPRLREALLTLYSDPAAREKLIDRGSDRVRRLFSIEAVLPQYIALFREVLNEPSSHQRSP